MHTHTHTHTHLALGFPEPEKVVVARHGCFIWLEVLIRPLTDVAFLQHVIVGR